MRFPPAVKERVTMSCSEVLAMSLVNTEWEAEWDWSATTVHKAPVPVGTVLDQVAGREPVAVRSKFSHALAREEKQMLAAAQLLPAPPVAVEPAGQAPTRATEQA